MKRLLIAVSFAVLATPVLADAGKPFEQTEFDRGLSNAGERRLLADASSGATRSDREIATDAGAARSVWANDHNFISPAQ